jgi:hypothetical protein
VREPDWPRRGPREDLPVLTHRPEPAEQRRLTHIFRSLGAEDRTSLLAFAEFLAARRASDSASLGVPEPIPEPVHRPRPEGESVIAAIRRLSATYSMLDRGAMLNETSSLMSAHVLQGQGAAQTIDGLEALFVRHYETFRTRTQGTDREQDPNP